MLRHTKFTIWIKTLLVIGACSACGLPENHCSAQLPKLAVYTSPFSVMSFYQGPGINLGINYFINETYSLYSKGGINFPEANLTNYWGWQNLHGYSIKEEFRKYTGKKEITYWSISGIYGSQAYIRTDSFGMYRIPDSSLTYANRRNYFGVCADIGQEIIWNHVSLELSIGGGFRINQVINDLSEETSNARNLGDWTVPTNYVQKKGTHIMPRISFGLRIGLTNRKTKSEFPSR